MLIVLLEILSYLIAGVIQELDHIIEGLKFQLFVVGPLELKRNEDDKFFFYYEKNLSFWLELPPQHQCLRLMRISRNSVVFCWEGHCSHLFLD